ncbi:MliC family protein [Vibrio pectenicida]|uniref:MliC family protein n=1 Tax=Vibrio pectenicida TaxID=62763 RepID=UPI0020A36775|nr:MliC family protein [Vibrio pectenicida]
MMNLKVLNIALLAIILQGCSSQYVTYYCPLDKHFDVAFSEDHENAVLRLANEEYSLMHVPAGSGAKYILKSDTESTANPLILHTKGDYARLEVGSEVYKGCKI